MKLLCQLAYFTETGISSSGIQVHGIGKLIESGSKNLPPGFKQPP